MKKIIALVVAFSPIVAFAQSTLPINNINDLSTKLIGIGNLVTYLLIAGAVIFIIWNVVRYLIAGGDESRKAAGGHILWGIVGLFVILSIWGLVNILTNTFKTTPQQQQVPTIPSAPQVN